VKRITGELADLAERAGTDAERLLSNARHASRRVQATARALAAAGGAMLPSVDAARPAVPGDP